MIVADLRLSACGLEAQAGVCAGLNGLGQIRPALVGLDFSGPAWTASQNSTQLNYFFFQFFPFLAFYLLF